MDHDNIIRPTYININNIIGTTGLSMQIGECDDSIKNIVIEN